jgi:uncharacterized membrane protein YidH (DUF202 family)
MTTTLEPNDQNEMAISAVQLVLAEKRTSLSVMRTGIAVLALPLSVMSVLIATSRYYDVLHVLHFFIPMVLLIVALLAFGIYLVIRSIKKLRHYDQLILGIKAKHSMIGEFLE